MTLMSFALHVNLHINLYSFIFQNEKETLLVNSCVPSKFIILYLFHCVDDLARNSFSLFSLKCFLLMHEHKILRILGVFPFSKYVFIWGAGTFMYINLFKFRKLKALLKMFCIACHLLFIHISQV